jgi:hypothetical protein
VQINFTSLMNSRRFHPTNTQMKALEDNTKAIIGETRISHFALTEVKHEIGMAVFVKDGVRYKAARLESNGRWYLTGDYTF